MSLKNAYLDVAARAVNLLDTSEVAAAWDRPSALPEWNVSGLSGHLAYQILSVTPALRQPASDEEAKPVPVLEHYTRAVWIDAPLDGEVNSGIRAKGEALSVEGVGPLIDQLRTTLEAQRPRLAELPSNHVVFMPQTGWSLTLDDFLLTRMVELAVHLEDLASSTAMTPPELPEAAFAPVLTVLTSLAARRHGQAALLRTLTRTERAPGAINVF
ncbi:maleylpyruvate isomerase N-terminal domain-containing protein [Streptomyces sp. V3I7]|uniref:maleylpyruvate isomerase N-terminal domain-containing protein n=1 Tax=Streptomyces sp. V3I7 TaxID=3042278 RepID=UPI00277FE3EC|nr:maleylpyruvate isomerase N-terminal domain-containing protein [Streptomyces sp. V3I7]MDQ0994695.1 hypothetical protein [Streptomyces sp. V3I7]